MEKQKKATETHFIFKFWLFALIFIGILKIVSIIFFRKEYLASLPETAPNNYDIFSLLLNSMIVVFFLLLLRLKKWAFYGIVFISVISILINFALKFYLINFIFVVSALGILMAVMQLKKNGISAWQALH